MDTGNSAELMAVLTEILAAIAGKMSPQTVTNNVAIFHDNVDGTLHSKSTNSLIYK